ncbi:MAG: deoxynucleoside kinase [Bacteroidales bacterium]|jgi:deoxyadenosine/deoxycytidine kinase|nr:deoxynucleoside kinase [Bacteroidales bacterium]
MVTTVAVIDRIEICGNIASGKTTLAQACDKVGYKTIFEDFSNVPFLSDFYNNPAEFAFETETAFTLFHYYQLKKLGNRFGVSDFSLIDDYAFALTTLSTDEFIIYEKMFDYIVERIGLPKKVLYLVSSVETLLKRINKRGRENEQTITADYLSAVQKNIQVTCSKKFATVPFVSIDTSAITIFEYNMDFISGLLKEEK